MATERLSRPELKPNQQTAVLRSNKIIRGIGYGALGYEIAAKRHGVIRQLEEQRPIHIVAESPYRSTGYTRFLKDLLSQELGLQKDQQELLSTHNAARFDEEDAQMIIEDRKKPFILPMVIGESRSPQWSVGPLWFINKLVYYEILKEQFQELH